MEIHLLKKHTISVFMNEEQQVQLQIYKIIIFCLQIRAPMPSFYLEFLFATLIKSVCHLEMISMAKLVRFTYVPPRFTGIEGQIPIWKNFVYGSDNFEKISFQLDIVTVKPLTSCYKINCAVCL